MIIDHAASQAQAQFCLSAVSSFSGSGTRRSFILLPLLSVFVVLGLAPARAADAVPGDQSAALHRTSDANSSSAQKKAISSYGQLPLVFEPNQGQTNTAVKFMARGAGYGIFLTGNEAVLSLLATPKSNSVVRMQLAGAQANAAPDGEHLLAGKSNYFIGNDPAKWQRGVPQFGQVRYAGVYPGVDLIYRGNQGKLEFDFRVAPGADAGQIALNLYGPSNEAIDRAGNLVSKTAGGDLYFKAPHIYQELDGREQAVAGRFVLRAGNQVGFEIGAYDRSQTLVIDPALSYSTYLGGSGGESCSAILGITIPPAAGAPQGAPQGTPGCPGLAVDSGSNAYIVGATTSTDFPTQPGGTSPTVNGPDDVFVTKLNTAGTALVFTTFLGGSGTETSSGVAVDSGFDVFVAGTTNSTDFPTISGYQTAPEAGSTGTQHVFVSKLDPNGVIVYSTYLSGNGTDKASGVAIDINGNIYVTGTTTSTDTPSATDKFPATSGSFQSLSFASNQFFLTQINPAIPGANGITYSTYFGGGNPANGLAVGGGVAVDASSNVYITGGTNFLHTGCVTGTTTPCLDFPLLDSAQGCLDSPPSTTVCPTNVTALDAFLAKFNLAASPGAQLIYSTYLGGSSDDIGYGVAVDTALNAYLTGSTTSTDFNFTPASGTTTFQAANAGGTDAFLVEVANPCTGTTCTTTAVTVNYFTYLGGSGTDVGLAVAPDTTSGIAHITGWTNSPDFHTQNPVQAAPGGAVDAFFAQIDTSETTSTAVGHNASYLGGSGNDIGTAIAEDNLANTYVVGETSSINFPTVPGAMRGTLDGASDDFVTKLGPTVALAVTAAASPSPVGVGSPVSFTYTITNNGDTANGVTFLSNLPSSNATFTSVSATPGTCSSATSSTVSCNLGSLAPGATGNTVTVELTPTARGQLGNSATVSVNGSNTPVASASASATVNDFGITVGPPTATVMAGVPASYTVTVTPTGPIPDAVNLSCSSGLPTGVTCAFSTNPFPNLANGPVTSALVVNTTERQTTTVRLERHGAIYALWLPVLGLALAGTGIGGSVSRKRRLLMGLILVGFFSLVVFLPGCGTTPPTTTTTGTPAGTYIITVSATSGSATRTTTFQLVVQ